jgi:hypothetical protein
MANRKYEVIALSVGGKNNKIFNHGDIVTDENFGKDRADELVKGKFLKPTNSLEKAEDVINKIKAAKTLEVVDDIVGDDTRKSVKTAADKKIKEIKAVAQKLADEKAKEEEAAQKLIDAKLVEIAKCETVEQVSKLSSDKDGDVVKKAIEDKIADINAANESK